MTTGRQRRPPAFIDAIPPVPTFTGNRFLPGFVDHGTCGRCGDYTEVMKRAVRPEHPAWKWISYPAMTKPAIIVRLLCAWCAIADAWDEKRSRNRLVFSKVQDPTTWKP